MKKAEIPRLRVTLTVLKNSVMIGSIIDETVSRSHVSHGCRPRPQNVSVLIANVTLLGAMQIIQLKRDKDDSRRPCMVIW